MAATPFKVISWSANELITDAKMDAMVSNDNYLLANMTRGLYAAHGHRNTEGIKIAAGMALITARKQHWASQQVNFNGFFASVCKPIVATAIVADHQRQIFQTVSGIGKMFPDNRGFMVHVAINADAKKDRKIKRNFYVSWHALGF